MKPVKKAKDVTAKHIAKCCEILKEEGFLLPSMKLFSDYSGLFIYDIDTSISEWGDQKRICQNH